MDGYNNIPFFMVVEGIVGTGKTSVVKAIEGALNKAMPWVPILVEAEGTGATKGSNHDIIRSNSLYHGEFKEAIEYKTEALIYAAARHELLTKVVKPALDRKQIVLLDRYYASAVAYQGFGRQLGREYIDRVNESETLLKPDLCIVLDGEPSVLMARSSKRGHNDRIDEEKVEFFERAREGFLCLANEDPTRFKVVDAENTLDVVIGQCLTHVYTSLNKKKEDFK